GEVGVLESLPGSTGTGTGTPTDTSTGTGTGTPTDTSTGTGTGTPTDTSTGTGTDPDLGLADHCHLQHPRAMQGVPGRLSETVYAWVFEDGVTGVEGGDPRVRVELGVGPRGSLPDAAVAVWSWVPMDWADDTSAILPADNDQYAGEFVLPVDGAWDYAARVTLDDGATWSYCDGDGPDWPEDANGSDDGYDPADAGQLGTGGVPVDYCALQWPPTMSVAPELQSDAVYVRVYEAGVTPGVGAGAGVQVQLGLGPRDSTPGDGWTWGPMTYFDDRDGLGAGDAANDEYSGTFTVPSSGAWDYAGRASADGGYTWTLCDGGPENFPGGQGSTDGYQVSHAGKLSVIPR
ncbi:MAG: hypothetical protein RLZZ299_1135, partial [Pseudomonadota bacterium]